LDPGSPAVYAAPVPSPVGSTGVKQRCSMFECRIADPDPVRTFPHSWFFKVLLISHQISDASTDTSTGTNTPSQSTDASVQKLVQVLMNALQQYQNEEAPSNTTTTVDLATPDEAGDESDPAPAIDALLGDSDAAL
jgi:hypothetical protein